MNKLVNIIPKFLSEINNFSRREVKSFAYLSIEKILGYSKSDCIIHSNHELSNNNIISLENIINDIKQNIPIQYILGEAHFYDLKFKVNSSTLIPRGETEELVQYILLHDFISVLEIGTGSGCIAVSIAKNSNAKITVSGIFYKFICEKGFHEFLYSFADIRALFLCIIQWNLPESYQILNLDLLIHHYWLMTSLVYKIFFFKIVLA